MVEPYDTNSNYYGSIRSDMTPFQYLEDTKWSLPMQIPSSSHVWCVFHHCDNLNHDKLMVYKFSTDRGATYEGMLAWVKNKAGVLEKEVAADIDQWIMGEEA